MLNSERYKTTTTTELIYTAKIVLMKIIDEINEQKQTIDKIGKT